MPSEGARWRLWILQGAAAIWTIAFLIGLVILCWPEAAKRPLLPHGAWTADPVFQENWRPRPGEVSASILSDRDSRFFRSWPPSVAPAHLRSAPFDAPPFLAVPFAGYPATPEADLWLECIGNGRRLAVSRGNAHENWVERTLHLSAGWCRSKVQLVATSAGGIQWVAVGTPFESSRLAWLKDSVFVQVVIHALACLLLFGPGLLVIGLRRSPANERDLLPLFAIPLAVGYLQFFAIYYAPVASRAVVVAVAIAALTGVLTAGRAWRQGRIPQTVSTPLFLVFVLSLAYVGLIYAGDVGAGSFDANYRFDPATWSSDNQLQQLVAEALRQRTSLTGMWVGWHVSDRPPLLSGVFLLGRPLWQLLLGIGDNTRLLYYFYQISGMVASTLWVIPVWVLLGRAGVRSRQRLLVIGLLATQGPIVFNSTFIWPKMLAGALTLAGYITLRGRTDRTAPLDWKSDAFSGMLIGLGMMSHSGVFFALPFAVPAALWQRRLNVVRGALVSGALAALIMLPWMAWQRIEDPPGNALTKFALAGTFGFDQQDVGLVETIRTAYADMTLRRWAAMRVTAFADITGLRQSTDVDLYKRETDPVGRMRLDDFLQLGRSLRAANVGWLILAAVLMTQGRSLRSAARARAFAGWCAIGVGGVLLNVVLTWSHHITHTQSYLSLLLISTGLFASLLLAPRWLRATIVAVHAAYFGIVWLWSPLAHAPVAAGPLAACGLAASLLIAFGLTAEDDDPSM